jgi:hypothetical protein
MTADADAMCGAGGTTAADAGSGFATAAAAAGAGIVIVVGRSDPGGATADLRDDGVWAAILEAAGLGADTGDCDRALGPADLGAALDAPASGERSEVELPVESADATAGVPTITAPTPRATADAPSQVRTRMHPGAERFASAMPPNSGGSDFTAAMPIRDPRESMGTTIWTQRG